MDNEFPRTTCADIIDWDQIFKFRSTASLPSIHLEDRHDPFSFLFFFSIQFLQIMSDDEQHNQTFEVVSPIFLA